MFCGKCGNQIKDGEKFCPKCGTPVKTAASVTTPKAPSQDNSQMQPIQGIPSITSISGMNIRKEQQKEKPKSNEQKAGNVFAGFAEAVGKKGLLIAGAAALFFIILIALNARQINIFLRRTFSSPEKYYQFVEKKTVDEFSEIIGEWYDSYILETLDFSDKSYTLDLEVEVGNDVKSIAELLDVDMSWLQNVGVSGNIAVKDNVMALMAEMNVNKNELLSGNVVMDMGKSDIYIQIPELSDMYAGLDAAFINDIGISESFFEWQTSCKEMLEAYPDRKEVEKLINRYLKIALKQIKNADKSKEEITVGDISQKFTVLEITFDEETVKNIKRALLQEMKNDKDIKSIMIAGFKLENESIDVEKAYKEFQEDIENTLEELDNWETGSQEIKMTVYVDGNGRIKGRDIDTESFTLKSMLTEQEENFAYEMSYNAGAENVTLNGSGEKNDDVINGDFDFQYNQNLLDIKVKEFNVEEMKKGLLNGRFEVELVSLSNSLSNNIFENVPSVLTPFVIGANFNLHPQVNMDFESSETSHMCKLGLAIGTSDLGSISLLVEEGDGKNASVPSTENAIMIADMNDFCEWMKSIELNNLIMAVNDSGLPAEVTGILTMVDEILANTNSGELNEILTFLLMEDGADYFGGWLNILQSVYRYVE